MADRINWDNIDPNDPRFYEADPNNPNKNISAAKYDPTDPTSGVGSAGAAYNEFLRTANVGDVFDWSKYGQPGIKSEFTGFNKAGTPMIQTVESPERQNWRGQIDPSASVATNLDALTKIGFGRQEAISMLAQSGLVDENQVASFLKGQGVTGVSGTGSNATGVSGTTGTANLVTGTSSNTNLNNPYAPGTDAAKAWDDRKSAYDLLLTEFKQYGLESLVEGIKGLIQENIPRSEFAIRLQDTDAYKKRFAANQDRIKAGLKALTAAEYIGLEHQYQNIMRKYGLPASYWSKDSMGTQAGFNKFIANDVSAAELEDRIATAQKRVINADPAVTDALRQFYPDITNADILAYTLDPTNALENIKRKVTAAEIQGAAVGQGLNKIDASTPEAQVKALEARARELAGLGVTAAQAQQGYGTIAEFLPTAEKLGDIYSKQGMGPYDQLTAEQEVFGTAGAAGAAQKRKKLSQLEQAAFGAQSGLAQGALARDRAGAY